MISMELMSFNEVARLTSLSRTAINNLRKANRFPRAVVLGPRRIAFVRSEVIAWIEKRISARPSVEAPNTGAVVV